MTCCCLPHLTHTQGHVTHPALSTRPSVEQVLYRKLLFSIVYCSKPAHQKVRPHSAFSDDSPERKRSSSAGMDARYLPRFSSLVNQISISVGNFVALGNMGI
ncbi:hypothetical protein PoB_001642500 [Plakobranchus ocellatus]|uniref:Uncharacterized protein n=1 Tax=Plakobranchus ocellatus TaxID=259542 RepID=A0AAV3Z5U7_9GAST|nr:hypothetical protein PoB_001642500 [Plakobranchus ocellatus]